MRCLTEAALVRARSGSGSRSGSYPMAAHYDGARGHASGVLPPPPAGGLRRLSCCSTACICATVTCMGAVISKPIGSPLSAKSTRIPRVACLVRALFTPVAPDKEKYAPGVCPGAMSPQDTLPACCISPSGLNEILSKEPVQVALGGFIAHAKHLGYAPLGPTSILCNTSATTTDGRAMSDHGTRSRCKRSVGCPCPK